MRGTESGRRWWRQERSEPLSSLHLDFKGDVDAALIPSAPPVDEEEEGRGRNEWRRRWAWIYMMILNPFLYCFKLHLYIYNS